MAHAVLSHGSLRIRHINSSTMKTRNTATVLLSAALLAGALTNLRAQTAEPAAPAAPAEPAAPAWAFVLTPSVATQYMFRGVRLGGLSLQPSLEADYGNFAVGIWASTPLSHKVPGQSDPEIDPYGSYTFTLAENLTLVPGFTFYTYPRAPLSNGFYHSTFEPSLALNYTVAGIKFTPKIYYDVVLNGPTYELTVGYVVPLKELGTELDFTGVVGSYIWKDAVRNSDPKTKNWGDYYQIGVAAPFEINKQSKVTLGIAWVKGSNNYYKTGTDPRTQNTAAIGRGVATVSYIYSF